MIDMSKVSKTLSEVKQSKNTSIEFSIGKSRTKGSPSYT